MRRFALIPAVLLAMVALSPPTAAFGAAPDFKDRFSETFTDDDFCGTGVAVEVHDHFVAQTYEGDTVFRISLPISGKN